MSQYSVRVSSSADLPKEYKSFLEAFYEISDKPNANDLYAAQFTKDGTVIMSSVIAKGTSEIVKLRENMWEKVSTRAHHPEQIFPYGKDSEELMLYGTVDRQSNDGTSVKGMCWAARAHLVYDEDGKVKMSFYQVCADTAPPSSIN